MRDILRRAYRLRVHTVGTKRRSHIVAGYVCQTVQLRRLPPVLLQHLRHVHGAVSSAAVREVAQQPNAPNANENVDSLENPNLRSNQEEMTSCKP